MKYDRNLEICGVMLNIILADDHKIVRKGLKALLSTEPDFRIVGEAENGQQALELVEKLQPDVLVLDLMMPIMSGLEVTRSLCQKPCRTSVVILSMHNNEAYVIEALRLGAKAYILKESPPEELINGIREVAAGNRFLGAPLSHKSIDDYTLSINLDPAKGPASLTKREEEIAQMVSLGLSNHEISGKLGISTRTVETHRNNLIHKLKLYSQIEMGSLAIQQGTIPSVDPPG
jgi:DNA-binding NarL/FixJ family response regulator